MTGWEPPRAGTIGRLAAVLVLACGISTTAPAAEPGSPQAVVERIDATLIGVMKEADELGYRGRFAKLEPVLDHSFDFGFMARVSVGKHWRDLDEAQRAELVEAFRRLSTATFAARFDGYSGQRFEVTGEEDRPRDTKLVLNTLHLGGGDSVAINFLLRRSDDRWRVIDVYLDAKFSELATKRSEFTSVIDREGFESLIRAIDERIERLASQNEE